MRMGFGKALSILPLDGREHGDETGDSAAIRLADRLRRAAPNAPAQGNSRPLQGLGARARLVARLPALDDGRLHAPLLRALEDGREHPALSAVRARRPRRVGL